MSDATRAEVCAVAVAEAFRGNGEILTRITVPTPNERFGAAYARFALRDGNAIAVASVAASLTLDESGTIREACLSMGAVAQVPLIVDEVAASLPGRGLDDTALAAAA